MRATQLFAPALLVAALVVGSKSEGAEPRPGCAKTYTRAHFHAAARSTFDQAFPLERKRRTLARVVRCQRRPVSGPIVRKHRRLYRHAWAVRFYFEREWARVPAWAKAHLDSIRWCESRDNYRAIGGGGAYRGAYQFSFSTWRTVGGYGDPAAAPEREQDVRAAWLLMRDGSGHWPVCQ